MLHPLVITVEFWEKWIPTFWRIFSLLLRCMENYQMSFTHHFAGLDINIYSPLSLNKVNLVETMRTATFLSIHII